MKTFENKIVLITGGTSGIGKATALAGKSGGHSHNHLWNGATRPMNPAAAGGTAGRYRALAFEHPALKIIGAYPFGGMNVEF